MTATNARTPDDAPLADPYIVDPDAQARGRTNIGLPPHRDTAPRAVQRPPDAGINWMRWWLVFFLVLLLVAMLLLLAARVLDPTAKWPPAWPAALVTTQGAKSDGAKPYIVTIPGYAPWLDEDFDSASANFGPSSVPGQLETIIVPESGVYRMRAWPEQMVWSLVDPSALPAYRLETGATVDTTTPAGTTGLIGRFLDPGNFYLFEVDGSGAYRAELWREGQPFTLQAATPSAIVMPAGQSNRLALEDDGNRLRFYVNQALLFEVAASQLPPGSAGIAVRAAGAEPATGEFDWLVIYAPAP